MSGGVDSAVAAGLLLEQGYEVIGVNLHTWEYEAPTCQPSNQKKSCCSPQDIRDARDVGIKFNIPFYVIKMEKDFSKKVIDRFIDDYRNGLTPNPCVECNTFIKFGALFEKARALGIEKIATGHYARIKQIGNRYAIANARYGRKNQAYYLYGLSQENLQNAVFPLGDFTKEEVRQHARRFALPVAEKPESQEICFIPENDYRKFLQKKGISFTPGYFRLPDGEIIGEHSGKEKFTIGQRKGLGISWKEPLYVLSIEKDGTIYVGEKDKTYSKQFIIKEPMFQGLAKIAEGEEIQAMVQIRYRHTPQECTIVRQKDQIIVGAPAFQSVTPGQSAVVYSSDGEYILFGGIISVLSSAKEMVDRGVFAKGSYF